MKHTITLVGEESDRVVGALRSIAGQFDVDMVEDDPNTGDPAADVVFFLDRISMKLGRIDRRLSKLSAIDSTLSQVAMALDQLVIVQRERLEFEREQAKERALHIQK